jgi:hypothetical protein
VTDGAHGPFELDADAMRALLAELDERLRERGVAASVYVSIARSPRKPGLWLTSTA